MWKEGSKYCFQGSSSGRNCCSWDGTRFTPDKVNWVRGKLHPNGRIVWSHGYTTEFTGDLCEDQAAKEREEKRRQNDERLRLEEERKRQEKERLRLKKEKLRLRKERKRRERKERLRLKKEKLRLKKER